MGVVEELKEEAETYVSHENKFYRRERQDIWPAGPGKRHLLLPIMDPRRLTGTAFTPSFKAVLGS
jgi:hypothetical protein